MRRGLVAASLLGLMASCFSPETARFYGGYWATTQIDNTECHARAAAVELVVPRGEPPPVLVLQPAPSTSSTPVTPTPPAPVPPASARAPGTSYKVDIAGIGAFDVAIHARAGVEVDGVSVPSGARIGVAVAPPAMRPRAVPGFVFGVDLRPYQHIVFVVDNTADMCGFVDSAHTRVILDDVIDQVIASLAGLPIDRQLSVVAGSGKVRQLVPNGGDAGRRVAMEWTCGLLCEGNTAMTLALVRAFDERPDVVVLLSNGAMPPPQHSGNVATLPDLASLAADPADALARMEWTAPVIAIDIGRGANRNRLLRIAEITGGSYVAP